MATGKCQKKDYNNRNEEEKKTAEEKEGGERKMRNKGLSRPV